MMSSVSTLSSLSMIGFSEFVQTEKRIPVEMGDGGGAYLIGCSGGPCVR